MSGEWLVIIIAVYLFVMKGPQVLATLREMAKSHGDDPDSGSAVMWQRSKSAAR